jgi:hypothetical protein
VGRGAFVPGWGGDAGAGGCGEPGELCGDGDRGGRGEWFREWRGGGYYDFVYSRCTELYDCE